MNEEFRKKNFTPCKEDRPLVVQFTAKDPEVLLTAAKFVKNDCDAIDINFGAYHKVRMNKKYGSVPFDYKRDYCDMVEKLVKELKMPVSCKIKCLPSEAQTLDLAKSI